ncbi:MAG: glycosyltransferase family 4 protein [Acetobacteraceae bacterium]|nr:glycosyltransferase family 4 protein [Acetobacteraceae bacterium]
MRVVHVVRQFPPSIGGLEDAVVNVVRRQRATQRLDVSIVTLDRVFSEPGRRLSEEDSFDGVPVRRIAWRGSSRYPIAPSVLGHVAGADIVHVHGIDFFFDFLAWTKPLHRRRLVASTHGGFFHSRFLRTAKRAYFKTATRLAMTAYDKVVACSEHDAGLFAPIGRGRVVTIENGIDTRKFAGASSPVPVPTLIYFGRLARHKRIDAAIALLAALRQHSPDWRLIVVGSPGDQPWEELASLAARLGVASAVGHVASPDDAALRGLLGQASYYVSASAHEGFGIAAVEALSAGLVPILSDIPPFRKLMTRAGVGFLFDPAQPADAAAVLDKLHRETSDFPTVRQRAMRVASPYDWAGVADAYTALYDDVALPRGARPC